MELYKHANLLAFVFSLFPLSQCVLHIFARPELYLSSASLGIIGALYVGLWLFLVIFFFGFLCIYYLFFKRNKSAGWIWLDDENSGPTTDVKTKYDNCWSVDLLAGNVSRAMLKQRTHQPDKLIGLCLLISDHKPSNTVKRHYNCHLCCNLPLAGLHFV